MIEVAGRFYGPTDRRVSGQEYRFGATLTLDRGTPETLRRQIAAEGLRIGYRLLAQTSSSEAVFEHRASLAATLSHRDVAVSLWVPASCFRSGEARLVYLNFLVDGAYWFHDRGRYGTHIVLPPPPRQPDLVPEGP